MLDKTLPLQRLAVEPTDVEKLTGSNILAHSLTTAPASAPVGLFISFTYLLTHLLHTAESFLRS